MEKTRNIVQNCNNCSFYDKDEHFCTKHKIPVGNINNCEFFRPKATLIEGADYFNFLPYMQYYLNKEVIERMKKNESK